MKPPPPGRWCAFPAPLFSARVRLFCFPYAGGGASFYYPWVAELRPLGVELCALQLPGRETRLSEAPINRMEPLVAALTAAMEPLLKGTYGFFGHSMGALVAFEVARLVRRRGLRMPAYFFASGARAPWPRRPQEPLRDLPDAEFIRAVGRRYGGIPPALLEHQELVDVVMPALRSDLALFETYVYHEEPPLDCPVAAWAGRDDHNLDEASLEQWRVHTTGSFTSALFPGDHFYLQKESASVLAALTPALSSMLRSTAPHDYENGQNGRR